MDRAAKLDEIRNKQNRWMRERQAEIDRASVMEELRPASCSTTNNRGGAGGSSGSPGGVAASAATGQRTSASHQQQQQQSNALCRSAASATGLTAAAAWPVAADGTLQASPGGDAAYWASIKPEEVINRLTEKITDRLRNELKVELQRESDTWQAKAAREGEAMDCYLARELETQNTCPICYDLMVPPHHAPVLLFPCGHTFCSECINLHVDKHRKNSCPVCRKKIDSRAPNFSLQQLILNFVARRDKVRTTAVTDGETLLDTNEDGNGFAAGGHSTGAGISTQAAHSGDSDRIRRDAERMGTRLRVLRNELVDTITEQQEADTKATAAQFQLDVAQRCQAEAEQRLAAAHEELARAREQVMVQGARAGAAKHDANSVRQQRELLSATIEPLEAEVEKLGVLLDGLDEDQWGYQ